ncbi:hypothetical protein [Cellulomonas xylanilytica]|nr:hypothetical protein [Cellulomonas xylanilytica]
MDSAAPDWDAIDFPAARATAADPSTADLVAGDRTAGCALSLVADRATGWLVVVIAHPVTGETFVPQVVNRHDHTRMRGSVDAAYGRGPRLHYALACAPGIRGLRARVPGGTWRVRLVAPSGWAAICLALEDVTLPLEVAVLEDDAWVELD